jgi:hypothetical protein
MVSIEEHIFEQVLASREFWLALAVCWVYPNVVCSVLHSVWTYLNILYYTSLGYPALPGTISQYHCEIVPCRLI